MSYIYLIPLIPFVGFLINGLGFKKISSQLVPFIGTGAAFLSFVLVVVAFFQFEQTPYVFDVFNWFKVGALNIKFSFQVDQLSLTMLLFITGIGTLIHLYSAGYMHHDEGYGKFFAYLNLFLFSMIVLVLGSNYLMMFIGWEGVGLCSYLLIGFWYKNTDYSNAARKAFIMNRVGDLGFLVGMFLIIQKFGSLEFSEIFNAASALSVGDPEVIAITFALFVGAMGKSAQIPLFTWLPDAMAGPTPVSALIHAATMVTSGIYLIVRSNVLYSLSPITLEFVAWIGLATALLGATIGLFQNDIKKILAYSTVSQLGYMFLALGVMSYSSGLFHVITHAFFKALLFLGAGSVIHAMSGEQDIRNMGGLSSKIKITAITFLLGTIAISGFPPFSGFFSKDEILAHVFVHNKLMWALAMAGSFLTAFYMFRLYFLTFKGEFRGTEEQRDHLHESPQSMTIPLIILAVLSVFGGLLGVPEVFHLPHYLANYLEPLFAGSKSVNIQFGETHISHSLELILMVASVTVALGGFLLAYFQFGKKPFEKSPETQFSGLKNLIFNKYYVDEIYNYLFVSPTKKLSIFFGSYFDSKIIDGAVKGISKIVIESSKLLKRLQPGQVGTYILMMGVGIILVLLVGYLPFLLENIKTVVK